MNGRHPRRARTVLLLWVVLLLASPWSREPSAAEPPGVPAVAAALSVDRLAQLLHRDTAATASFHELQYRRVLKQPIERRGELRFEPPALFEKRVLQPVVETYRIEGETLSITLPKRAPRQLSLRNQPLLGSLLLGFKAVISGQLDTLAPAYAVTVSGTADDWRLRLVPTQEEVSRYIEVIEVSGRGSEPQHFEVLERGGDRTVTEIEPR